MFKTVFSETVDNPYVFDIGTVLTFIQAKHELGPIACYSLLIGLASCLVTSHSVGSAAIAKQFIDTLLETFFAPASISVEYEPDTQVGNLELLTQVLGHYMDVLLASTNVRLLIEFAVRMLGSSDRFVLRAASKFWVTLIVNESETMNDIRVDTIRFVGPTLVEVLVHKVSGDAARSELEYYTDVIKKLVFKFPLQSKPWFLASVVESPHAALQRRDLTLRKHFVSKIFNLRGARETNNVVKNFWLSCRGIIDYTN
jgi:hypothetical protein